MTSAQSTTTILRFCSTSVAAYDYLITIPAEYRIYRSPGWMRFGKISFVLIRYISIILLIISNIGYFHHGFSPATCSTYYILAPVFKGIQIMISQAIIGYRTWAITLQSKKFGWFLLVLGILVTALEWYTNLHGRMPVLSEGDCSIGDQGARWVFYLIAMLFDAVTFIISTVFLVRLAGRPASMSALARMLFYDGLGYMFALTAVNLFNAIFYHRSSIDTSTQEEGAPVEYVVIWIMSQRILIHLHDAVGNQFNSSTRDGTGVITGELDAEAQVGAVPAEYNPVMLERTIENHGLPGARDSVFPRGPRDHPETRTGGSSRV